MFDEKGRFASLNRRISQLFESSKLPADSSSSNSNEELSAIPLLSTDLYDSDHPVSVTSTASSGSFFESRNITENILSRPKEEQKSDFLTHLDMELVSSAAETLQATYQEMQSGLKNSYRSSNIINRRSRIGSSPLSAFGTKVVSISNKLNYVERVVLEIIDTERMYVQDLRSIVEDYLGGIIDKQELPMKPEQVSALFGNIEDIYGLNSELLQDLDRCSEDPVAVANCFVIKSQDFDIYTQYCNNYPNSVATLTECMRNKVLAQFFREKQEFLKQPLPLGAYLLKPVQRILKYHLLLQEIAKHFDVNKEGYEIIEEAIETMTGVAWYINDMKRKHEHAVRQQEIQSLLLNWKGIDLTAYGELVLEGTFRVHRARSERTLFLFDKALLITKKRGDHFVYKTHIPCASLMLIESTRDSLCFTLTHYKNSKQQHNVQAKTVEEKRLWTHHIKKLILENHHAIIPQKAKEAILEMDAIYPGRYKYSPERVKKAMSTIDSLCSQRSGRRQSEPSKHILKQLGEKVGLKHADSDGALLEFGESLRPSNGSLTLNLKPQTEGVERRDEEQPTNRKLNKVLGEQLSASEDKDDEEIKLGDNENKDFVNHETSKGFKRQNSHWSGNPEKRRSVEVFDQEVAEEVEKKDSRPEDIYITEIPLETPVEHFEDNKVEIGETYSDINDPLGNGVPEYTGEIKGSSSDEDEEETAHESASILPPSVLNQASLIAERFVHSISRRGSLALEDGKVIGCVTPKLTSRSSSLINLNCTDKLYQNGAPDFLDSQNDVLSDGWCNVENTVNKNNSVENVSEAKERSACKQKESILSIQDRQLIEKIKTYYDKADSQDASFSIKRRESLNYIPAGLVRNSVFKINSLPRNDSSHSTFTMQTFDSSSSNENIGSSRPASWEDVSSHTKKDYTKGFTNHSQHPPHTPKNRMPEQLVSVTDNEFKSPTKMVKVWEKMEKHMNCNRKADQQATEEVQEMSTTHQKVDNVAHESLIIVEESDLSIITEESQYPTPESTSPKEVTVSPDNIDFKEQDYKSPVTLHATFMQLASCMDEELSEKMKNKVYQLARQYSQRIKCKSIPLRCLKGLEEDLRKGSLPSVQEEKHEDKSKMKPTRSVSMTDNSFAVQDHSPETPKSAHYNDKLYMHLFFSDSPQTSSVRSDYKSPLSPVKTEKFHWPDVQELRSMYAIKSESSRSLPENRSLSVPDRTLEHSVDSPSDPPRKEFVGYSYSKIMKHSSSLTEEVCLGKVPVEAHNINISKTVQNSSNFGQTTDNCYYISAEAPLENDKKVIILEKIPTTSDELEKDTYVHIRSPTTREKISIKAVIERCKAYQESEYKDREEILEAIGSKESAHEKPKSDARVAARSNVAKQSKVKNLREKFQTTSSIKR